MDCNDRNNKKPNTFGMSSNVGLVVIAVMAIMVLISAWVLSGPLTAAVLSIALLFFVLMSWLMFGRQNQICKRKCNNDNNDNNILTITDNESETDAIDRILNTPMACPLEPIECIDGDYGSAEWDAGFKRPPKWIDAEKELETIATQTIENIAQSSPVRVLPDQCSQAPLPCTLETQWQGAFKGFPTTYIEGPLSCDLSQKDPRAWVRNLDQAIQERAMQNDMKWDPYKHFNARQMFIQFIANDVINQRATHERPIENLEEAVCFQRQLNGVPPGCQGIGTQTTQPPIY